MPDENSRTGFGIAPQFLRGMVTPNELAIYVALSWYADSDGCGYPSHAALARDTGMSVPSVKRALTGLRDKGLVTWRARGAKARGQTSNAYRLRLHTDVPVTNPDTTSREEMGAGRSDRPTPQVTQNYELDPMNKIQTNSPPESCTPLRSCKTPAKESKSKKARRKATYEDEIGDVDKVVAADDQPPVEKIPETPEHADYKFDPKSSKGMAERFFRRIGFQHVSWQTLALFGRDLTVLRNGNGIDPALSDAQIYAMFEAYAVGGYALRTEVPWKDFLNRKHTLMREVNRMADAQEREANRLNEDYWGWK